jgi:TonB-dependent receptor
MSISSRTAFLAPSLLVLVALAGLGSASAAEPDGKSASAEARTEVSDLVVTAPREEAAARRQEQDAPNLVNVQSAETIEKYPDFNAAEALGRVPGISISTDTGEGRFVNIRGIDGNLAGATFGGVPLLNTNPGGTYFGGGGRAVEYDTLPTGAIDGLVVYKTTLPDHEAEGLGGSVDLTPRSAAKLTQPFFSGTIGDGYEPMHRHDGPLNLEAAVGARFGFSSTGLVVEGRGEEPSAGTGFISNPTPFGVVLSASRREDRRGFDDIEQDYNDPSVDRSYADIQMRRYDYHRRRFGYGGEFDFRPNEDHAWYLRANEAGYVESVKKNRLTYDDLTGVINPLNPKGFATATDITLTSTDEEETHRNGVFVAGGQDRFGAAVLDYRASYSTATFSVGKNYGAKFTGPQGLAFAYDNSANNGDTPAIVVNSAIVNDPANYKALKKVSNSTANDTDHESAYAANLLLPVDLFGPKDQIKFGVEARLRDKASTPSAFTTTITPLSLSAASGPAVTNFYGRYTNGPDIDIAAIRAAAAGGVTTGGVDQSGVFTAKEDIYAGYGQYQAVIGKLNVLVGVRVERTDANYGAYSDDNASQALTFVNRAEAYTNVFPTVQLRYEINPNFLIRATYSTGIGRPGFLQNTAATSSNHDPTDPLITQGNPALKPTTGNNFDLSLELYLPHGGIFQVGAFDKEFNNYIVTQFQRRIYAGTDPTFAGLLVGFTTFSNRDSAYARGLEAAYHQKLDWLPGLWSGLGVEANVTLVDSRIQEYDAATSTTGKAEYGLLPGTSRMTGNLALFYEKNGLNLRLAAEHVSKEQFSIGGSKAADTIQDDRTTLDFTASYAIASHATVYFQAKNLTNAPLRFYVSDPSFPIQREYYDQTYEAGVRFRF